MTAKIITDLPADDYHARPEISKSGLDLIARSPAHYRAGFQKIASDTARIGRATHAIVLEGGAGVVTGVGAAKNTKAGKDAWAAWFVANGGSASIMELPAAQQADAFETETGLTVVSPGERIAMDGMAASVREHPVAGPMLDPPGDAEVSIIGAIDDVPMRCRLDWWTKDRTVIVDLKTSVDATRHAFRSAVARYRYQCQHAVYANLAEQATGHRPRFVFVVVEKAAPFACAVYELDDEAQANGDWLVSRDLKRYRQCVETDTWPSYEADLALDIPIYESEPDIPIIFEGEAA